MEEQVRSLQAQTKASDEEVKRERMLATSLDEQLQASKQENETALQQLMLKSREILDKISLRADCAILQGGDLAEQTNK